MLIKEEKFPYSHFIKIPLIKVALAIFIGTSTVLYFLQLFDITHGNQIDGILRVLSYGLTVSSTFWLLEKFVRKQKFNRLNYKLLLWYLLEFFLIINAVFLCKTMWVGLESSTWDGYFIVVFRVFSIGFTLLALATLFYVFFFPKQERPISLSSTDKNADTLQLKTSEILALENERNYTTVYYVSEGELKNSTLRGSLNHFEKRLKYPLLRIHRSHIINMDRIEKVSGNSQGKNIKIQFIEKLFGVSRNNLETFEGLWNNR